MEAKDVIENIKQALGQVKEQNQEMVSIAALEHYLDDLEKHIDKTGEISFKLFQAEHERNLTHYEAQRQHSLEMLRSVFTYGQAALNSSMLINGGAAAALLAFIGNIWQKPLGQEAAASITTSVAYFAFGVLAAAVGTATSYVTQYSYTEAWLKTGIGFHVATVILVLGSYALFGLGSYEAYAAFTEHLKP